MVKTGQDAMKGAPGYQPLQVTSPPGTLTFTVMLALTGPEVLGKLDSSQSMAGAFAGCKAGKIALTQGLGPLFLTPLSVPSPVHAEPQNVHLLLDKQVKRPHWALHALPPQPSGL